MAVPTISSITPAVGPTHGRTPVSIVGANFRLYEDPPPTGPVPPKAYPPVSVLFGSKLASRVEVYSATELLAFAPVGAGPGAVSITLQNQDEDTGVGVSGEIVVVASAFTYAMPLLRPGAASNESDFARLVRTLIQLIKSQVIPEVMAVPNADWTDAPSAEDELRIAKFPAIVLAGPATHENRFYSRNERSYALDTAGRTIERYAPKTVDLEFQLLGVSDNKVELLNLHAAMLVFMLANTTIYMDRDPADPSKGQVGYLWEQRGDWATPDVPNNSNVRSWSFSAAIVAFEVEGLVEYGADDMTTATTDQVDSDLDLDAEHLSGDPS